MLSFYLQLPWSSVAAQQPGLWFPGMFGIVIECWQPHQWVCSGNNNLFLYKGLLKCWLCVTCVWHFPQSSDVGHGRSSRVRECWLWMRLEVVLDVLTLGMNPWGFFVLSGGIFKVSKLTSLDVNWKVSNLQAGSVQVFLLALFLSIYMPKAVRD